MSCICLLDGNICRLSEREFLTNQSAFITNPGFPDDKDNTQIRCSCDIWPNPGSFVIFDASFKRLNSLSNDCNATFVVKIASNETTKMLSCRDGTVVHYREHQGISSNITVSFYQEITDTDGQYEVILNISPIYYTGTGK